MNNLIKETLQAEVASLQAQLDLIQQQAQRLQNTLDTYQQLLAEQAEVEVELVYEDEDIDVDIDVPVVPVPEVPEVLEDIEAPEDTDASAEEEVEIELELIYEEDTIEEPTPTVEMPDLCVSCEEEESVEAEPEVVIEEPAEEKKEEPTEDDTLEVQPTTANLLPHIDDIRKAISLGDRFLFQRELFKGNGELMTKTIDKLNNCESFEEAGQYISKHFVWDKDSEAFNLFINILKRRW